MDSKTTARPVVVITGFGLFGRYQLNPSWEAVKLLDLPNVNLVKKQINVEYDVVDRIVPEIWKEHQPTLMIHVGVSCMARGLVLETCANSTGYCKPDANQCVATCEASKLADGCVECLTTHLDVVSLCDHLNQLKQTGKLKLSATLSSDAGRYLCEYIYYSSLKCDPKRTLFVHVPEINEAAGFTVENIRDGLQAILEHLISKVCS